MTYPAPSESPRRAPHRSSPSIRGVVRRKATAAPSRSSLVADFLTLCELDSSIEDLRVPTGPAAFEIGGELIEHVVDFEIVRDGTPMLVDVVADIDLAGHPLGPAAVAGAFSTDGRLFAIETAASLRAEPRYTTLRLIMACKRTPVSAGDRVRILHHLDECGTMRLVDCASVVQNAQDGVAAVLALAVEGLVAVDINRPILPETPVRRRKLRHADPFEF